MSRLVYFIPYAVWLLVTFLLVERSVLEDKPRLITYLVFSFLVAIILEVLRNR